MSTLLYLAILIVIVWFVFHFIIPVGVSIIHFLLIIAAIIVIFDFLQRRRL